MYSTIIFGLTLLATNISFPFWKIYSPETGVSLAFTEFFMGFPIAIINGSALLRLLIIAYNDKRRIKKHIPSFITLCSGCLIFAIGFIHNNYQSIPANNLNLYLKQREHIVSLIKSGKLHSDRNCLQNMQLYEDIYEGFCREVIELPENYKGLSRNGRVDLTKNQDILTIQFIHSIYNFGDGSVAIVYSSSDEGLFAPKWEINPPPILNNQPNLTEPTQPSPLPTTTSPVTAPKN